MKESSISASTWLQGPELGQAGARNHELFLGHPHRCRSLSTWGHLPLFSWGISRELDYQGSIRISNLCLYRNCSSSFTHYTTAKDLILILKRLTFSFCAAMPGILAATKASIALWEELETLQDLLWARALWTSWSDIGHKSNSHRR